MQQIRENAAGVGTARACSRPQPTVHSCCSHAVDVHVAEAGAADVGGARTQAGLSQIRLSIAAKEMVVWQPAAVSTVCQPCEGAGLPLIDKLANIGRGATTDTFAHCRVGVLDPP